MKITRKEYKGFAGSLLAGVATGIFISSATLFTLLMVETLRE